ncbi:S8 family serine peptidase [Aquincola sp. S2]|uniref:S8 family serine peptidase n=1 Tax=Pseudaquabacterium terrae TaxID=2732868 RepID=A0ABX2EV29_9BURK|nr:SAV_2336 N-terminal domain-related protein [Aquabacterium terrae]NRF72279.1 S8 family serine peptidase [Aquabacterium terrae]
MPTPPPPSPPTPPPAPRPSTAAEQEIARWRQRVHEALRLLDVDASASDPLTRADALWLARVLPDTEVQATGPIVAGSTGSKKETAASRRRNSQAVSGAVSRKGAAMAAVEAPVPPSTVDLFVQQPAVDGGPGLAARRLLVPAADALPGRSAIERALRPLLRRRPSSQRLVLDTEATALASARASADLLAAARPGTRAQALVPVLRPMRERWFDVALLAEQDPGMLPFEDTLHALRDLMARHGAFGRVRLWRWSVQGDKVAVRTPSGQPAGRRAMVQVQRPQIVLVVTHGVSGHWGRLPLREFMHELGRQAVLGLVQVLPAPAWGFTALGAADERVRNRERGGPNRLLQRLDPWSGLWRNRAGLSAVPVLELEANSLARWARWVMAPRLLEHAAAAIGRPFSPEPSPGSAPLAASAATQTPPPPPPPPSPSDPVEAEAALRKRVLQFRAIASPQAFALLRLLAGAWITLPVMRLLLASLPGPPSAAPLAEVLLSGLLRRTPPAPDAQPTDPLVFEFEPGVRDWLHGSLSREERAIAERTMAASREQIRRFVEQVTKTRIESFAALLLDPSGDERLPASARSFVEVSRRLRALRGAGGPTGATLTGDQPTGPGPRPGSAALGALHGFPLQLRELVGRPTLEASLRSMLLALREGATLALTARPGAGARTMLAELLRERSVRERYPGGIWFGTEPPARSSGDPAGARLAVRLGGKARGGDASVELRWYREGEVHIDLLSTEEVNAYLGRQNISSVQLRIGQQRVHRGVPSLIGVFSVGTRLGTTQWPRTSGAQPERNWAVITQRMLSKLPDSLRMMLIRMGVRQGGYFGADESGAELAMQLGWRVVEPGAAGGTLAPSIGKALGTWYPDETVLSHASLLNDLMAGPDDEARAQYASRHLLFHGAGAGGREGVTRVLADRVLLGLALKGGIDGLLAQLEVRAKRNKVLDEVRRELLGGPNADVPLVDRARSPLMPDTGEVLRDWLGAGRVPGADGRGIRVALLSTGVDATHPELQHVPITGATTDPDGHGTGVASLIVGRFAGVAPGASLQSLALRGALKAGPTIIQALEMLLAMPETERAHIVCLPFGWDQQFLVIEMMLKDLLKAGIVVIAAAGNYGAGSRLSFPASMAGVLGVGALDAEGSPALFSSRAEGSVGQDPELWAPGAGILAAQPGLPKAGRWPARYQTQNGTSQACAIVVGLAAIYAQVTGRRGSALREVLLQTALDGKARFRALLEPHGRDEEGQGDSSATDVAANTGGGTGSVAVPNVSPEEDGREALHARPSRARPSKRSRPLSDGQAGGEMADDLLMPAEASDVTTREDLAWVRKWLTELADGLTPLLTEADDATRNEILDTQIAVSLAAGDLNIASIKLAIDEAKISAERITAAVVEADRVIKRVASIKSKLELIGSVLDFFAAVLTGSGTRILDGAVKLARDLKKKDEPA